MSPNQSSYDRFEHMLNLQLNKQSVGSKKVNTKKLSPDELKSKNSIINTENELLGPPVIGIKLKTK